MVVMRILAMYLIFLQLKSFFSQNCPIDIDDLTCQCSNLNDETLINCDAGDDINSINITKIPQLKPIGTQHVSIRVLEIKNKQYSILPDYILNTTLVDILRLNLIYDKIQEISKNTFSNLAKLESLNLCYNRLKLIKNVDIFSGLESLKTLDLRQNQIESIESTILANLTNLIYLDLSYNQIKTIKPNSFISLFKLTEIHLNDNLLTSIDQNLFNGLPRLQAITIQNNQLIELGLNSILGNQISLLDLSYQNLKNIDVNAISQCNKLTLIDLQYNQLKHLSQGFVRDLKSLSILLVNNNLLENLVYDNFGKMEKLSSLSLANNFIRSIENGAFINLKNLKLLFLTNNLIRDFNKEVFRNLLSLKELGLDKNRLSIIKKSSFDYLINLNGYLRLSDNYISTIEPNSFESLPNLTSLYLANNKLTLIDPGSFKGLRKLTQLVLTSNQIEIIEVDSFNDMSNLNSIDISKNRLKELDSNVFNGIVSLKTLILDYNQLFSLNGTFSNLKYLTKLSLANNLLSWIDSSTLGIKSLEYLDISNNNLVYDRNRNESLQGYLNLTSLILRNIGINLLQMVNLKILKFLKELTLSNNEIEIDSDTFVGNKLLENLLLVNVGLKNPIFLYIINNMGNLKTLDLSSNNLNWSLIDHGNVLFQNYLPIGTLYLRNVSLTNLNCLGLDQLEKLEYLDLSNNQIESIKFKIFSLKKPYRYVNLNNNLIKEIDSNSFNYLFGLVNFDLSGNRLLDQNNFDNINIVNFVNLSIFYISGASLFYFPLFKVGSFSIKTLNLSSNKIYKLNSTHFEPLLNLVNLNLENNNIRQIDATNGLFKGLTKLQALDLSRNFLDDYNLNKIKFEACINLEFLNLSRNNISTISEFLFSDLKKLKQIDLSYNYLIKIETNSFYLLGALKSLFLLNLSETVEINENFKFGCDLLTFIYISSIDLVEANLASFTRSLVATEANRIVNEAVYFNSINIIVNNYEYYKDPKSACKLTIFLLSHNIQLNLFNDFDFDVFILFCYSLDLLEL